MMARTSLAVQWLRLRAPNARGQGLTSGQRTRTQVRFLGWKNPLEEGMSTQFSTLAWEIPWTEEPGGLQSMGWQRVGHG